jgi:hypothetical protein
VRAAQDLAVQTGWQGALVAALLSATTMPFDLWMGRDIPGMPYWAPLTASAAAATLAAALLGRRRTTTARFNRTAFLLNMAAIFGALWMTSGVFATQIGRWIPFQANKLGALAAALLAPDLASGLLAIGGFVGMVVLRQLTFSPEIVSHFPTGEPWTIFIYGIFSGALLSYRLHAQRLERQFLTMRSETAATERLARTFLAVRDFSNTPLQTIELSVELIRARDAELAPIADRIDRSVDRLFRLHHTFSAYESYIKWTSDDVSPNAGAWDPARPEPHPGDR